MSNQGDSHRPAEGQNGEMDARSLSALEVCYRLLEDRRDPALCGQLYPDLSEEIRGHVAVQRALVALSPVEPDSVAFASGRRQLLSELSRGRRSRSRSVLSRLSGATIGGWLVALSMFSVAAVMGASASTDVSGPMDAVLSGLHITTHSNGADGRDGPAAETAIPAALGDSSAASEGATSTP